MLDFHSWHRSEGEDFLVAWDHDQHFFTPLMCSHSPDYLMLVIIFLSIEFGVCYLHLIQSLDDA